MPTHFFLTTGATLNIHVLVGESFAGERWAGKSSRITHFLHYSPKDTIELTTSATQDDTLRTDIAFAQPGVHLVSLATNNAFITLEAAKFNQYLEDEGLDNALSIRKKQNALTKPGRELYRRCAKTLLRVGAGSAAAGSAFACRTGLPLELVPEQNPYALKPGAAITILVLAAGQPLTGAAVHVWQRSPGKPPQIFKLHSNQNGRVLFRLHDSGDYMVSTVQMTPATGQQSADWQSTWSTLTFGFAERSGR